jgi:hypothetical protein
MSDHQLFLLPSAIGGYGLEEKLWSKIRLRIIMDGDSVRLTGSYSDIGY